MSLGEPNRVDYDADAPPRSRAGIGSIRTVDFRRWSIFPAPAERPCSCPGASSIRPRGQRQPWATGEPGRRGSSPRAATSTAGMAAGLGHVGVGALLATRVGRRSRRADEHRAWRRANQQSSGPDRPRSGLLDPQRPDRPVQPLETGTPVAGSRCSTRNGRTGPSSLPVEGRGCATMAAGRHGDQCSRPSPREQRARPWGTWRGHS